MPEFEIAYAHLNPYIVHIRLECAAGWGRTLNDGASWEPCLGAPQPQIFSETAGNVVLQPVGPGEWAAVYATPGRFRVAMEWGGRAYDVGTYLATGRTYWDIGPNITPGVVAKDVAVLFRAVQQIPPPAPEATPTGTAVAAPPTPPIPTLAWPTPQVSQRVGNSAPLAQATGGDYPCGRLP